MKVPDKLNEYTDTEEALKMIISSDIDNMINWNDYHISGDIEEIKKIVRAHGIINVGVDDLICTMSTTNTNYVTTGKGRGSKRVLIALKQAIERLSVKLQDIEKVIVNVWVSECRPILMSEIKGMVKYFGF